MNYRSVILSQTERSSAVVYNNYPLEVNGIVKCANIVDKQLVEVTNPINPVTGFRDLDVSRLLSPDTPQSEKELILKTLAYQKGYNSPKGLSDSELLSLIPSRYMSDPVEIENYRQFVEQLKAQAEYEKNKANNPEPHPEPHQTGNEPVGADPVQVNSVGNTVD